MTSTPEREATRAIERMGISGVAEMNAEPTIASDELSSGTSVRDGRYRIEDARRSTRNSFNYRATMPDGSSVEIKEFYLRDLCVRSGSDIVPRDTKDARILARLVKGFVQDASFLTSLDCPSVATVREVFQENGTAYMVSERPGGTLLADLMSKPGFTLTPEQIVKVGNDLALALIEIHGFGMLHRDITPSNILIADDGTAVLLPDFGTFREDRSKVSRVVSSVLQSTQDYAPYELAFDDKRQGDGSDIYSMAAVLYHLMTGAPPAPSLDRIAAVAANEADPYVKVEEKITGYDQRFLKVIDFALELFLESRIKSATEFTLISAETPDLQKAQDLQRDVAERSAPVLNRGLLARVRSLIFR